MKDIFQLYHIIVTHLKIPSVMYWHLGYHKGLDSSH